MAPAPFSRLLSALNLLMPRPNSRVNNPSGDRPRGLLRHELLPRRSRLRVLRWVHEQVHDHSPYVHAPAAGHRRVQTALSSRFTTDPCVPRAPEAERGSRSTRTAGPRPARRSEGLALAAPPRTCVLKVELISPVARPRDGAAHRPEGPPRAWRGLVRQRACGKENSRSGSAAARMARRRGRLSP
jgi:hypothetical protein